MTSTMFTRRTILAASLAGVASAAAVAAERGARTHIADLGGAVDAAQHGLTPGAEDDQGAALESALKRAGANGRPLFLPPGRYSVSEVVLPQNVALVGVPGESRLVFRGGAFLLRARGAERLRLEGIVLDGQDRPLGEDIFGLLHAEEVRDLAIEDCDVEGSAASGVATIDASGRIARCRVHGVRTAGIRLIGSRGMSVADNVVEDCGDTGILVQRWDKGADDTIVRGNRVSRIPARSGGTGQTGNGVNVVKANGVIVEGNRVDDCAFSAVRVFSSDNSRIAGNIASGSGETALYVEFASEGAIVADNIVDGAAIGISFANFLEHGGRLGVCSGNLVRNIKERALHPTESQGYGVGISAEADIAITGNVVESAPVSGVRLGWGPYLRDVAATGNVIRDADIGIEVSVVEGAGAALIADNVISGAKRGAILGMRWDEAVTEDLARAEATGFPHLTVSRNRAG